MDYPVEAFTDVERARLAPHVTNLDRPVFALVTTTERSADEPSAARPIADRAER